MIVVDDKGVRASSLAENLQDVQARFRATFGEDLSLSPQTPQAQIAGILAFLLTQVGEAIVEDGMNSDVEHAGGTVLDQLMGLLDVRRIVATYSRVTATLTGVAATGVPVGSRAKTADGDVFQTLQAVVLSPAGVTVEMRAIEQGPVEAAAGTLTQIVTVVAGWETITNANAAVLGVARQSDASARQQYVIRTAHSSIGPMSALEAALSEAEAGKVKVAENNTDTAVVEQEWRIAPHSVLVIAENGSDADVRRAVENHRSMGAGTVVAINGGTPDNSALDAVTDGTVTWNGNTYTGLNLSAASTSAQKATALTTLLNADPIPPTISYIDGRYVAIFNWSPTKTPQFGTATVEDAFGLDPDAATYPPGPFIRPKTRDLVVTATVTRHAGFPGDGLAQIRTALLNRVTQYAIGEQVWLNDLLCEAERVTGSRITAITVQYNSADVSGVDVPLDILWALTFANLTITIT